jgi:hypothetical protein
VDLTPVNSLPPAVPTTAINMDNSDVITAIAWDEQSNPSSNIQSGGELSWDDLELEVSQNEAEIIFTELNYPANDRPSTEILIEELVEVL